MAIGDVFKITRKTFFNPSAWINYDYVKAQNKTMWGIIKDMITLQQPAGTEETFEQAIKRMGLTKEDVENSAANYRAYALGFAIFGVVSFCYAFYLIFVHSTVTGWMLAIGTSALFFAQAFRYDFWAFQMRRRKLGATFAEWRQSILGGK